MESILPVGVPISVCNRAVRPAVVTAGPRWD
ncbi:hypothetical protein ABIE38_000545 [Dietzia sp. 2505]